MGRSAGKPCAIHRHARNGGTVYQVSVSDDAIGEHVATVHCKREVDAKQIADEFVAAPDMAAALLDLLEGEEPWDVRATRARAALSRAGVA